MSETIQSISPAVIQTVESTRPTAPAAPSPAERHFAHAVAQTAYSTTVDSPPQNTGHSGQFAKKFFGDNSLAQWTERLKA